MNRYEARLDLAQVLERDAAVRDEREARAFWRSEVDRLQRCLAVFRSLRSSLILEGENNDLFSAR